ncbi:hypothetical protein BU24DRAFT_446728 [Aaosphaeria arxii CBS 175.79]|uniref:Uncharacterized protein n=1 Tax=Aaosphaeria arxii CBS 175.79 TaxID=1450172 RepID=A0A6A5Y964_9PLEO|nr:uncharacterized protein BU24DRAFT_446728 [Aaosphaeria arxii CBS 175.79]KAF2021796.1 hypothetical protein BU24DRAFT_446728 [Aaosphaeria arxii CBS 175.79]
MFKKKKTNNCNTTATGNNLIPEDRETRGAGFQIEAFGWRRRKVSDQVATLVIINKCLYWYIMCDVTLLLAWGFGTFMASLGSIQEGEFDSRNGNHDGAIDIEGAESLVSLHL